MCPYGSCGARVVTCLPEGLGVFFFVAVVHWGTAMSLGEWDGVGE